MVVGRGCLLLASGGHSPAGRVSGDNCRLLHVADLDAYLAEIPQGA